MSKITHMKRVVEYQYVFIIYFKVRQDVIMKYKQVFIILNISFKVPLKIIYLVEQERKNHFRYMVMD